MLLIPVTGKISWRNPPAVTLCLIIINILVYFLLQGQDYRLYEQAAAYYFDSGLAEIEMPHYIDFRRPEGVPADTPPEALPIETQYRLYSEMSQDAEFIEKLHGGDVISPEQDGFDAWQDMRKKYETIRSHIVALNYGFRPAFPSVASAFTYMFLHGGFGHLFGNMIFLWILGCLLEMGFGRRFVAGAYVATGITAVGLFWLTNLDSAAPLIGASGSIAGLMGAFALLFGKARVKVFYSLGFYFNYVRFPAVALFPLWIGNEFFQLFFTGPRHVAYVAHIGGLIGGALIGFGFQHFGGARSAVDFDDDADDRAAPLIEKALQRIGVLDMEGGRRSLEAALEIDPQHCEALGHLFNIEKIDPTAKQFHLIAARLLDCLCNDPQQYGKVWETYEEYRRLSSPPRLTPNLYLRLSKVFCNLGRLESAERILVGLLKKKRDTQGLPEGLLHFANTCKASGAPEKQQEYLRLIRKAYPEAPEGAIADNLLKVEII